MDKLLHNHWFDNQAIKLLEKNGFLGNEARDLMQKTCSLAAELTNCPIGLLILPDFQTRAFWSEELLHPDALDQLIDLAHLLKEVEPEFGLRFSEQVFFKESTLWTAISAYRYFNYTEIKTENGQSLAWLCVFDVKYRSCNKQDAQLLDVLGQALQKELMLTRQLEVSTQIQNNLIHFTAHDLRNPLAGILSISQHLTAMQDDPEGLKEISGFIQQSAQRMLKMLEEVLKCGSLESGRIQLKVSPSNFHQVLLSALRNHQADAERKGQQFRIDLEETETLALLDYARMTEVLDNLLSNAVKYAPKGAEIEARTSFQEEFGLLEFSLYNPGVGLTEEDKSRIFQKFSKLSAKPTGGEGSTGLGLSIARTLTEMHGGNIRAESDGIDKGVRFILQIPVSRVA